jgi:3-hydroxybutyryl-CoA dehydrogenase
MKVVKIRSVAIIGIGVMGSKVAWACAVNGLDTYLYDTCSEQINRAVERISGWFFSDPISETEAHASVSRLHPCESLEQALAKVDLAFENVPEVLELKQEVHSRIGHLARSEMLMGSNASSLLCSPLAEASGRPEKFFNMNFTDPREQGLVELMWNPKTTESTKIAAKEWARSIKMVPVATKKEIMGYAMNRIWRAIKKECLFLADQGYADIEDIDRGFMLSYGTPYGPFGLMDKIGLHSIQKVEMRYYDASRDESDKPPELLNKLVEKGHLGELSGKGFYNYPDPNYEQTGWLRMEPPWLSHKDRGESDARHES